MSMKVCEELAKAVINATEVDWHYNPDGRDWQECNMCQKTIPGLYVRGTRQDIKTPSTFPHENKCPYILAKIIDKEEKVNGSK